MDVPAVMAEPACRQSILSFWSVRYRYGVPSESTGNPGQFVARIALIAGTPAAYPGLVVPVAMANPAPRKPLLFTTQVTVCVTASVETIQMPVILLPGPVDPPV